MRYISGQHKETGEVKRIDAESFPDNPDPDNPKHSECFSYIFNCWTRGCTAQYAWRRASQAKENIEGRGKKFAHKHKFPHIVGCKHANRLYTRQHRKVEIDEDDLKNFRLSFMLGASPADFDSKKLPPAQLKAANDNINKKPFNNLQNLINFMEKKSDGLFDSFWDDLKLHNQGESHNWRDLVVMPTQYSKLLEKSQQKDDLDREAPVFTGVRPDHVANKVSKVNLKFMCKPEADRCNNRIERIQPVIICLNDEVLDYFQRATNDEAVILVAGRPFHKAVDRWGTKQVYLTIASTNQLASIDKKYRRLFLTKHDQQKLGL